MPAVVPEDEKSDEKSDGCAPRSDIARAKRLGPFRCHLDSTRAIDDQHLATDERCPERQKRDGVGDIVRRCRAFHRRRLNVSIYLFGVVGKPAR